ncbi:MAG: hypothetical protein EOM80_10045 [Erysipelotrichia bacterium]|nr:hypothetical protein [Erysipelotrichia bacterium]
MSLQRRLTRGISAVLAVILVFMVLTSMSYWDIEGFVQTILPANIAIARSYEKIAGLYAQLGEIANENFQTVPASIEKDSHAQTLELEQSITKLEALIKDAQRQENLRQVKHLSVSFIKQIASYELLIKSRNRLLKKNSDRRAKASETLRADVISLLDRFKSMMIDFKSALKNPDFQASIGGTSSLMEQISRIEKDLILAETEVALYLSLKKGKDLSDSKSGKSSANRVENRLRAILFLLDRSIHESRTSLHKRVLKQVETKIRGFYESFQNLRNILEAPESELLEIEDQLNRLLANLQALKQKAVGIAAKEADFFWNRIFSISDELMQHASNNHNLIFAFLLAVLASGIYLNIVLPKQIGGPIKQLSTEIANFKFGNEILEIPQSSGTEEIDALGEAFKLMVERLNLQAEVNRNYLESIHSLTHIYRELHETEQRIDLPNARREKAVNMILQQLISQCPQIDLVKVMVIHENPENPDEEKYLVRLGDHEFSDRFKASDEFKPYCMSVGYNPADHRLSCEEKIPLEQGLSGWNFVNNPGIKTGVDDASFFQPVYSPPPFNDNPILTSRAYEKGLNGSLITEMLNVPHHEADEGEINYGLLFVYFLDPNIKLSWQEIFFIQIIAGQVASIIETDALLQAHDQKKKIDDQLNMAREIQENLLPQTVPNCAGLKISRINKPAAEVGGDYFDFFDLGNNRLGVVIADASGKNVPAAIIMTVFKTTLSTMELANLSANEVLSRANRIIAKNITNDRFITAMYVIIDATTGEVELSSAGHNPAFVASGRGMELTLHEKNVKCMPLGILENYKYETTQFTLKKGDLLFLYTDGVTEARNETEEEFGESRLKKFLNRPRAADPAKAILHEIQEFSKYAKQHDDITAVSIEFNGGKV